MLVECESSHGLPFVYWRPRKAGGFVPDQPEALRCRGFNGVSSSPSLKVLEPEALKSGGQEYMNASAQVEQIHPCSTF